jgi:Pyruvate/2-oxoacid:ferredoxin oxidoreductase delta subunit
MILASSPRLHIVIYRGEGSLIIDDKVCFEILHALLGRGYAVSVLHEVEPTSDDGACVVLVMGWFMEEHAPRIGESLQSGKAYVRDVNGMDTETVLELVETIRSGVGALQPGLWKPWFPVIDYARCVNCLQCLSFCLFGVYGTSPEGILEVRNEASCKTDCPACARICPEAAIMFPKYRYGPVNGDTANTEELQQQAVKIDIPSLLGGDTLQALRNRNAQTKTRFSKDRDGNQAMLERQHHLQEIQRALDIPVELLPCFPSVNEARDPEGSHKEQD